MDTVTEDFERSDVDAEMMVLTPEDITEKNLGASDEVEDLQNSLREAVHDDNVQPKMQCLMMDSSFSMVTMQGEDSGIAWETTPSRCSTPWASEAGHPMADASSSVAGRPGSVPAGKIIFVMDEELISRRKKTKERVSSQKTPQDDLGESSDNISGRPELVEFSEPNVKAKEGSDEEPTEPPIDKDQWLFSLVSEGSEILNIVVPPKLATVDEEESKEMVDNLSYLEQSPVTKASEETNENELLILKSLMSDGARAEQIELPHPIGAHIMDPPGAPVARRQGGGASGNVDYFEPFTLIDAQAPGSPAVIMEGQVRPEAENTTMSQDSKKQVQSIDTRNTAEDNDWSDTVSLGEITSELLDEVFYCGTDNYLMKSLDSEAKGGQAQGVPLRLPPKPSGSTLFGSQEDILTPIFLPEGPPKIIDQILLEEPKAMAFLYTDLYEEAIGSRQKEEDRESLTSEKSFHSRHSDREARGYLEKYALIDETPAVQAEPTDKDPDEGPRSLSQDLYDFNFLTKPEKGDLPNYEDEITDFFRSSANSSPCDMEPLSRSVEDDDVQVKSKAKTNKSVSIKEVKVDKVPVDPLSSSSSDFLSEELDWGCAYDFPTIVDEEGISSHSNQRLWKQDLELQKPVAPPRKKATTSPKTSLDLTPLTPVDMITQETEEAGGKEQRQEEKETASPGETADEADGDGEKTMYLSEESEALQSENVQESNAMTFRHIQPSAAVCTDTETEERSETAIQVTESEEVNIKSSESAETEVCAEKQGDDSAALSTEPAKDKGRCIIL
ncbi:hypothetical protein JOB18_048387 [Solea senegalensis]|uniref:Cardiomyopathy-associated protein 5 n=1 Tax=Solea senegalensis TaxID=28829 RepID=A0AAV6R701_SOLSE|nr:hypothetical protein JOB18_048387 [Solea senegalensis]